MSDVRPEHQTEEELRQAYDELMLRIAFQRILQDEAAQAIQEAQRPENKAEADAFFARTEAETLRVFRRALRAVRVTRFTHHTLPRAARVAAACIAIAALGIGTAMAAVPAIRARVLELIMSPHKEYTKLQLVENPALAFDVPEGWGGDFFPSIIPDGYEQIEISVGVDENAIAFSNEDGSTLCFFEYSSSASVQLDTENAISESVFVNGNAGLVSEKNGHTYVSWSQDDRFFILLHDRGKQSTLEIAAYVRRILK